MSYAPTVLSLFSGIGGLDLGLERCGCETVAYSDIDDYANKVMARRFPDAVSLGDITTIECEVNYNGTTYIERGDGEGFWLPPIDIIAAGFPCQDISAIHGGGGIAGGKKSGLWREVARIIRSLEPRLIILENVANIRARGLDIVLSDLAACGYDAEWDCVPASSVGAPHRRERWFCVAHTNRQRLEEYGRAGTVQSQYDSTECGGAGVARTRDRAAHASRPGRSWSAPAQSDWWETEPDVDRMVDGIPRRVDRLRCLGNAVVPQVAEHVARIALSRIDWSDD